MTGTMDEATAIAGTMRRCTVFHGMLYSVSPRAPPQPMMRDMGRRFAMEWMLFSST
jgi:hypothetical protein